VISNHDTPAIHDLYNEYGAELERLRVRRSISCNGARRLLVGEVLAVFNGRQMPES